MTDLTEYLSILGRVPASYFVYSAFSYFGLQRGGELPGSWFVRALARADREEAAVRQTLYRMERARELRARRSGRMKLYSPSPYARAEIEAGTRKIFDHGVVEWDGEWTLVRVGLRTPPLAVERERVVALLAVEGFVRMDANLFLHPRSHGERLREAIPPPLRGEIVILRGKLLGTDPVETLMSLWNLDGLRTRYQRVLERFERLDRDTFSDLQDEAAFLLRFALVFEYLEIAWEDPELPGELLPGDWPGPRVKLLASRLYERFLPGANRIAERLLTEVLSASGESSLAVSR